MVFSLLSRKKKLNCRENRVLGKTGEKFCLSINPIFSAFKLFFFSSQQRKNQFMKSSKSLKKEEREESSSLGCNESATAILVGMDSIVMDKGSSNKISIFIFFLLSIVNPFFFLDLFFFSSSSVFNQFFKNWSTFFFLSVFSFCFWAATPNRD